MDYGVGPIGQTVTLRRGLMQVANSVFSYRLNWAYIADDLSQIRWQTITRTWTSNRKLRCRSCYVWRHHHHRHQSSSSNDKDHEINIVQAHSSTGVLQEHVTMSINQSINEIFLTWLK